MTSLSTRSASTLWIVLLTAASTMTTLIFSCATPFPALAALAAVHMRRQDGITLMLITWAASQIVGFGILGHPHSLTTMAWAVALGMAAVVSVVAAYAVLGRIGRASIALRLALAYVAGFIAFKGIILLWSLGLGETGMAFAPKVLAEQFVRNAAILIGLLVLYRGLTAIGVPAAPAKTAASA